MFRTCIHGVKIGVPVKIIRAATNHSSRGFKTREWRSNKRNLPENAIVRHGWLVRLNTHSSVGIEILSGHDGIFERGQYRQI